MRASRKAVDLIKRFESLRREPYLCPAGIPTIGYGHTAGVSLSMLPIEEADAVEMLADDLDRYERAVNEAVKEPIEQHEFDALVCLTFNIGIGALRTSSLLRHLNAGDRAAAAVEFLKWNMGMKAGHLVVMPGLVARRAEERRLFEGRSGS